MNSTSMFSLSESERGELVEALRLVELAHTSIGRPSPFSAGLLDKILTPMAPPRITVGVHGGQVQWVIGNPFPVLVCDYDGEACELPEVDVLDQKCRAWLEPIDGNWCTSTWHVDTSRLEQPVAPLSKKG